MYYLTAVTLDTGLESVDNVIPTSCGRDITNPGLIPKSTWAVLNQDMFTP